MRPPCFLHFLPGAPRFPFVFQPRATSRAIHVTVFCARKAIRAPGDEAGFNIQKRFFPDEGRKSVINVLIIIILLWCAHYTCVWRVEASLLNESVVYQLAK